NLAQLQEVAKTADNTDYFFKASDDPDEDGVGAYVEGANATAADEAASAIGFGATAYGGSAMALGELATASGYGAVAAEKWSVAYGVGSQAVGQSAVAVGGQMEVIDGTTGEHQIWSTEATGKESTAL